MSSEEPTSETIVKKTTKFSKILDAYAQVSSTF